uniref:Peptidase S1 domain-containing protein n=1 Tax=Catharus ustulatus TaxID=91951 RepID=A0A8C3UBM4_CATUS
LTMNRLGLLVLLTVAGLAHGLQYTCGNVYDYGLTRIVGGSNAREASWPWMVSIQHPYAQGNKHWCGGSLISSDWVLTAAHCFDKIDLVYVVIGATQLSRPGPGAVARTINKVVIHRDYKRIDFRYDIALMQLNQPVQCSSYIQLACVATPTLKVSELSNCWIAGWGQTTKRSAGKTDNLQEAKVQLIDLQLCNSTDWYAGEIHPYNLCAGATNISLILSALLQGDSGGPLMCQDNSADYWWVVGLTSFGNGCGRARQPGVYISTQHFYEWIDFNMPAGPTGSRAGCTAPQPFPAGIMPADLKPASV